MKGLQFAVVLLIVCISCAEALVCNTCQDSTSNNDQCIHAEETCKDDDSVCASGIILKNHDYKIIKGCLRRSDTFPLNFDYGQIFTCTTNLCN